MYAYYSNIMSYMKVYNQGHFEVSGACEGGIDIRHLQLLSSYIVINKIVNQ